MDNVPSISSATDLEYRAARIADPGIDLKTKYAVACELREMIDTIRDSESARVIPQMIPVILEVLRSGKVSFQRETTEYDFRRVLLDILHRIPSGEAIRPQVLPLFQGMLYLLRHDNEDNGVTCCKSIVDIVRTFKALTEELVTEFMSILHEMFRNAKSLVQQILSEDSPRLDPNTVLPSIRSFKVLAEMGMVVVSFIQSHRNMVGPAVQASLPLNFEVLSLESPAQKKAREDYEATGGIWSGIAPTIKNSQAYSDLIGAQIKMVSYLAYVLRGLGEQSEAYGEALVLTALRLCQDCPAHSLSARRDLLIVMRHLFSTNQRKALLGHLDTLLDERVLLGNGVAAREFLRSHGYYAVVDLIHHLRSELEPTQLARFAILYLGLTHNPNLTISTHILGAKMAFNSVDIIVMKHTKQNATRVLLAMIETSVDKLESMLLVHQELLDRTERSKNDEQDIPDMITIEKARPVSAAAFAVEKADTVFAEHRMLYRTFVHGFRTCIAGLHKLEAPIPDGTLINRVFEMCIRGTAFFDGLDKETNEVLEWVVLCFTDLSLHIVQEVWTQKMTEYFDCVTKRVWLLHVVQQLLLRESISPTLVPIVLEHLIEKLPQLGEYDDQTAAASIRLFKMAFSAVTHFPAENEPVLASHLGKLIMDCFPLAAKASKPTNYFHLLRGLFRAIGGGGGKFELLYKEVLPLLPEMLECLNRQLYASSGFTRDLIVELCLTVPLRLTHLLPHLTYLMQPLALALRGGHELVSQGLRTLELCIDNLTPDFLDPTLNTVLRELMEALHDLLKPLPANHLHAHTTIRILGKLGGRNRKLLDKEPSLDFRPYSDPARIRISFSGCMDTLELGSMSVLALRTLKRPQPPYHVYAYNYLENCLSVLVQDGVKGRDREEVFVRCLEGVFDAVHIPDLQSQAENYVRELSKHLFTAEIRNGPSKDTVSRRYPSPMLSCYLEAFPAALARENPLEGTKSQELVSSLIRDLVTMVNDPDVAYQDIVPTLHHIASRFSSLCLETGWIRKSAGCSGIKIMTCTPDLGVKWINDREVDLVRTLLHVLKDMPYDLPRDVEDVVDVLIRVLRVSNADLSSIHTAVSTARNKLVHLTGIFFGELASPNPVVRQTAQRCIQLLSELSEKTVVELLLPLRDKVLSNLYTKPLRALPFSIQIGIIEAVRYCVSLEPPLPELNDELLRLLHEVLALADADDAALIGRGNPRQSLIEINKLRVACIKLLTASMALTDFFSKQIQTRQKVSTVYFKSLYSTSPEIKEVAYDGLRKVLAHQNRLPKELLQTGLRPILMNLADPKRLSIPGLEGLARLLELLTNYFKVEIGHKLLDHFRFVADPEMLQASSKLPLHDNEGIIKLVRITNIFHLLPSTANIFLENLINSIVQIEARMEFSGPSPFSPPLAKYLDRYPVDAMDFFMRHLHFPRHVRTLRSILEARLAPRLMRELVSRASFIVTQCLHSNDHGLIIPGLLLCHDMASQSPAVLKDNQFLMDGLINLWKTHVPVPNNDNMDAILDATQRSNLMVSIFLKALEDTPRIDILFDMTALYTHHLPADTTRLSHFLYHHVAMNDSLCFRRNVLLRFFRWFPDPSYSWAQKTYLIRLIISPMLLVHAMRAEDKAGLIDEDIVKQFHLHVWQPMNGNTAFGDADDMFKIELLHLTTVMVQHYSHFLVDVQKAIIMGAWHYITSEDVVVKYTAYLLAARFFDSFPSPEKLVVRAWTGLLRPPHSEGKSLVRQALDVLAPALPRSQSNESGYPQWAKTTRRLLAEEGNGMSQILIIYQLIVRQRQLFYPVRAVFIPHMVNSLVKLGLSGSATNESRLLSIEVVQVIFDWEQKSQLSEDDMIVDDPQEQQRGDTWVTPISFRESMVSYLVRLATALLDQQIKNLLIPRALTLLRLIIAPTGWNDVTVKLHYFARALEQADPAAENYLPQAIAAAKVLQVVSADKNDEWYRSNAPILQKLVRKGMVSDDSSLHDALHPAFDRLVQLYPLPKEGEEDQTEMSEFHTFVHSAIGDSLLSGNSLRGALLMLKSVIMVVPDRVIPFSEHLIKLFTKLAKEHTQPTPAPSNGTDNHVRLMMAVLDICQTAVSFIGQDNRQKLILALGHLMGLSKSIPLCRYILDMVRTWTLDRRDPYPTMKERAMLLQKMVSFENRPEVFDAFLELVYDIYTSPSLRRSELTTRLEPCFFLGCRARDATLRERFIDLLDISIPRTLSSRLTYILGVQSWEPLSDHNWLYLALHLLLGTIDGDQKLAPVSPNFGVAPAGSFPDTVSTSAIIRPIQRLLFLDPRVTHDIWVSFFSSAWLCLSKREQGEITHHMITLLSREYHIKQVDLRPNVIQTLLTGVYKCSPSMLLPPHLVKYLAKTFGAWHVGVEILENYMDVSEESTSESTTIFESLAELYAELAEADVFYGLWRRGSLFADTNMGIAFEQNGMWDQASIMYESAQNKARTGIIPFNDHEYSLWEDHWMLAAEKLQHWDILYELARGENNYELMLESAWRIKDWSENVESLEEQIHMLPEVATPRRRVFEAFLALLKAPGLLDKNTDFTKILEDAMQLSLRKWISLPPHLSAAHVPLLQHFQQFIELQEAVQIFGSLSTTTAQNLEKKSSDLKMVLQAWRERLPNLCDDISIWSDLVAWRQNIFNAINKTYLPLIQAAGQNGPGAGVNANTFGYRGFHETAWIINRFAHVARKHDLLDVCSSSLNKIYTLPNIEISEAFLKLREQARCHYQRPNDLQAGLEVINNTNLMYFSNSQKAEFYTLKGMFHTRFGRAEEATSAFNQAIQLDLSQAKAWAALGKWNDNMFKENPSDMSYAATAMTCYLNAAGTYKSSKSRPLLTRILWLLSVDDSSFTISRAFDTYKGEAAFWYWITLIPQLCLSISQREVKQARYILLNLAKLFPQALFFPLRTTREDMMFVKRAAALRAMNSGQAHMPTAPANNDNQMHVDNEQVLNSSPESKDTNAEVNNGPADPPTSMTVGSNIQSSPAAGEATAGYPVRQAWDHVEEVVQILKTAFPLLILCMETLVDQINQRFKATAEEEIYRLICMLLQDAIQTYVLRMNIPDDDGRLGSPTLTNLKRMANNLTGPARKDYEDDFLKGNLNHYDYMRRLQQWRDRYEKYLDSRPRVQPLDLLSHYLTEFQYGKFDDIEVPGQYSEDKDNNQNFVKIQRFGSKFENCRSHGYCWRRFTMHGNDNSTTTFAVQLPSGRHCRREERVMQLFRTFNGALSRKKEGRKRNLTFHLPAAISCSPSLRLLQNDASYVTLGDIYDHHCEDTGITREETVLLVGEKAKTVLREYKGSSGKMPNKSEYFTVKTDVLTEVVNKLMPNDVLTRYMIRSLNGPSELWRMRKQFTSQIAATSFMTYVLCLTSRLPSRFHLSRATGQIAMSELLPGVSNQAPVFASNDAVPFRFTPNMQKFVGPILQEGVLVTGIMAIGRCLTEPEFELEHQLCLFARDEVITWLHGRGKPWTFDLSFRTNVAENIKGVVKRAETMACKLEREQAIQNPQNPNNKVIVHTVKSLIDNATNPINLMKMTEIYSPWF